MKTIAEMIAVMQAFADGKKIENKDRGLIKNDWRDCEYPIWNWSCYDYRIKPEPKYRQYKTIEEVLEAIKEHGHYVKEGNTIRILEKFTDIGEIVYHFAGWTSSAVRTWEYVQDKITWADGAPFGVKEE